MISGVVPSDAVYRNVTRKLGSFISIKHIFPGFEEGTGPNSEMWAPCYSGTPLITPFTMEDILLVGGVIATLLGVSATALEIFYKPEDKGCWFHAMEKTIGYPTWQRYVLIFSVISASLLSWADMVTDILVLTSYAKCGAWGWFAIGTTILVVATFYIAHNAARQDGPLHIKAGRFMLALLQLDLVVEGYHSVKENQKTINFARSKFLEGLLESMPQAFLSIYVLYAMDAQKHFWLIASTVVSILSLAYGLSEWLEIGVDERINLHTYWYHHMCRTCLFATDFALRLLTIVLVSSDPQFWPYGPYLLFIIFLTYILVTCIYVQDVGEIVKVFCLTFFINMLPAELRRREGGERFLYLVDPGIREQLLSPLLLVRIVDFLTLSALLIMAENREGHSRRGMTLGVLIFADIILVYCVRFMTSSLMAQHEALRKKSRFDLAEAESPKAKRAN